MNNAAFTPAARGHLACVLTGRLRLPSCTLSKQRSGTGAACSASGQGHSLKAGEARGTSLEPGDPTWGRWLLISPSASQQAVAGPAARLPCTASGCSVYPPMAMRSGLQGRLQQTGLQAGPHRRAPGLASREISLKL